MPQPLEVTHAEDSPLFVEREAGDGYAARRGPGRWDDLWVILGSSFYLFASLFTFRGTPFLLGGDQVYFWLYAQRMIDGQIIFRDFLQFTPPGTDLVFAGAFRTFGPHIWAVNLVALVLGVALTWLCFRIGHTFLSRGEAMLAAGLFVVLIYGKLINATHHWFSALAVLSAVAVLMHRRNPTRIVAAGMLLGLATFFTQTRGPAAFAGIALYLAWERSQKNQAWREFSRRIALLFGAFVATWLVLNGYFIAMAGLDRMDYWLVTYLLRYHASGVNTLGLPEDFAWRHASSYAQVLGVYLMLPLVYAVSLWNIWSERNNSTPSRDRRLLLSLVGLAMTLEVAMSPNWLRVYCAAAPGILLLVWAAGRLGPLRKYALGLMWLSLVCIVCWGTWSRRREQNTQVQLPSGQTQTARAMAAKLEWIAQHTTPGDYFFQAAWPGVYLPLRLRDPAFVDAFLPADETRPELVAETIRELEARQLRYILWSPRLNAPYRPDRPETYHLGPFREYMNHHYRRAMIFPDQDEIWERQ